MSKNRKRAAIEELNPISKVKKSRIIREDDQENEQELVPDQDQPEDIEDEEDEEIEESDDDLDEETSMEKLKEEDEEAYNNLVLVKEELERTEPDIKKILKAELRLEDKAKLCQYYEMYKMQVPNTEEWLGVRDLVNEKYKEYIEKNKQYQQYTAEQHKDMEEASKKYSTFNAHVALKYKILSLETSEENKEYIFTRFEELQQMESHDDEYTKLKNWLSWATELPYDKMKKIPIDNMKELMQHVYKRMDDELYGMEKVKEQLLVFIHAKLTNPDMKRCNLGLIGPPGVGKCLARDTPIIMFDGTIKNVQDIEVGDLLMGDDSKSRTVLSLARGREKMYKVHQVKGDNYTVNESHILSLKLTKMYKKNKFQYINNRQYRKGDIVDISVRDYIELSNHKKSTLKGFKVGIEFSPQYVPFDPYIIGVWLGDGSSSASKITNQDSKTLHYLQQNLSKHDLYLEYESKYDYRINGTKGINKFWDVLKELNLVNNKHIPSIYYRNSRQVRLQLLAGLIDSDGSYIEHTNVYEITQKNKLLANNIVLLCRSLGFYVNTKLSKKSCIYKSIKREGVYQRLLISGFGLEEIPVLVESKKSRVREQVKNALQTGIKLEPMPVDDYYGFTIDGNHRFLLGDFTVTHNTAVSRLLAKILNFPFEQISFGGIDKPDFLKGHEYTYIGAQPGAITRALKKMGCKNGILYFDEYEKISDNKDICSALLHICDPEQQEEFTDLFLNMKQDLRYLWMIYSMNSLPEDSALADRIFPIYIEGYTYNDKVNIICKHLLPKALQNAAMEPGSIQIGEEVSKYLINRISKSDDKGVRTIEKSVIDIVNKIKFLIAYQDEKGDVPLFKISFQIGKPLVYPVHITREIIDHILDKKELTQAFLSMYL